MTTCTFPVRDGDPCRKKAVCVFIVGRESYYRCRAHDSKAARAIAEEKGYERRVIEGVA